MATTRTTTSTTTALNSTTTNRLRQSLLNITTFTLKFDSIILRYGSLEDDDTTLDTSCLLLEGARLANQLIEDLIAFDIDGRTQRGVPRFPVSRAGVDGRAFVELYEAFNRECIDGMEGYKEAKLRERAFYGFWHALERSSGASMGHLVQ